jgi:hypothetical protein
LTLVNYLGILLVTAQRKEPDMADITINPVKRLRRETKADYSIRVWSALRRDGIPVTDLTDDQVQAVADAYGVSINKEGSFNRARLARLVASSTPKEV